MRIFAKKKLFERANYDAGHMIPFHAQAIEKKKKWNFKVDLTGAQHYCISSPHWKWRA